MISSNSVVDLNSTLHTFSSSESTLSSAVVDPEFDALLTGLNPELIETLRKIRANDTSLKRLDLSNKGLTDRTVKALAIALKTNTTLTHLDLSGNDIGDEGAKYLAIALKTNTTLTHLDLSGNDIGDEGTKYLVNTLKTNTTLAHLELCAHNIGDEGAKDLADALKTNTTLTYLNLAYSNIGDKGAEYLANALKINTTLTHLDLSGNNIEDAGARDILEALNTNTTVTDIILPNNGQINAEVLNSIKTALKRNKNLKNQIDAITKPLYKLDREGFPAWQTEPRTKAKDLENAIEEITSNPLFKKSKLVQELHGLKCLCMAHYYYNLYLFGEKNDKEEKLKLVIDQLSLAAMMGYHAPLVYKIAMSDINETKNPVHRKLLDFQLPGKDNPDRIEQRKAYPGVYYYSYSRLKLERTLSNLPEPSAEELENARPLRSVALRR